MILYFLIFGGVFAWYNSTPQRKANNPIALFAVLMGLALFVGFGDMLGGYDRYIYGELFDRCADCVREERNVFDPKENPIMGYRSEMTYVLWNIVVSYVTENRYIYILLTTIFVYVMLFLSFKEYAENHPFAILLFLGLWYFFTYTYLRQVMAASVAWFSYRYIIKKQWWYFLICWFVAYKFHNSAIVFLPLGFIPLKKYPKEWVIGVMAVLLLIGSTGITSGLYTTYAGAGDEQFSSRAAAYADDAPGFRWEYLFEVVVFLHFLFQKYNSIPNDRKHLLFLNCIYAFCGMLLLFIQSSNAGRQSWYFMGGLIFLFTYLFANRRTKSEYRTMFLTICFLLFFRIVWVWGILLYPYKTFMTDGARPGDVIHDKFEYDYNYDKDKFYRDPWVLW